MMFPLPAALMAAWIVPNGLCSRRAVLVNAGQNAVAGGVEFPHPLGVEKSRVFLPGAVDVGNHRNLIRPAGEGERGDERPVRIGHRPRAGFVKDQIIMPAAVPIGHEWNPARLVLELEPYLPVLVRAEFPQAADRVVKPDRGGAAARHIARDGDIAGLSELDGFVD